MYAAVDWQPFASLSTKKLYEILQLRTQVFVLEQQCLYQDLDGHNRFVYRKFLYHNCNLTINIIDLFYYSGRDGDFRFDELSDFILN